MRHFAELTSVASINQLFVVSALHCGCFLVRKRVYEVSRSCFLTVASSRLVTVIDHIHVYAVCNYVYWVPLWKLLNDWWRFCRSTKSWFVLRFLTRQNISRHFRKFANQICDLPSKNQPSSNIQICRYGG